MRSEALHTLLLMRCNYTIYYYYVLQRRLVAGLKTRFDQVQRVPDDNACCARHVASPEVCRHCCLFLFFWGFLFFGVVCFFFGERKEGYSK